MRLESCFKRLEASHKKALVPYILAGDPLGKTVDVMHELVKNGADIIELGFAFSDPVADGPVIAQAHERAVSQGVTLNDVFSMVSAFREADNDTPVILMGYLNPVEIMGYETFAERASEAGIDGVLMVDLPPEAAGELLEHLHACRMDMINLVNSHHIRRANSKDLRCGQWLPLLCVPEGCHRFGQARCRCSTEACCPHQAVCQSTGGRGIWYP